MTDTRSTFKKQGACCKPTKNLQNHTQFHKCNTKKPRKSRKHTMAFRTGTRRASPPPPLPCKEDGESTEEATGAPEAPS